MAKYKAQNDRRIDRGFDGLLSLSDKVAEVGMRKLLQACVDFSLEKHDPEHPLHTILGDTYGWALLHDGKIVDIAVTEGEKMVGDTAAQLQAMASGISDEGWTGILMAGMNHPSYYSVEYEQSILNQTIRITPTFFTRYFKPITKNYPEL